MIPGLQALGLDRQTDNATERYTETDQHTHTGIHDYRKTDREMKGAERDTGTAAETEQTWSLEPDLNLEC